MGSNFWPHTILTLFEVNIVMQKKEKPPKARRTWGRSPAEQVIPTKKPYNRQKSKITKEDVDETLNKESEDKE
jgi:hypothetical protein